MRGRQGTWALLTAIAALAIAVVAPQVVAANGAGSGPAAEIAGKKKGKKTPKVKVKVGDDFFDPDQLKVRKGTKVKWKWLPENGNPHNVTLKKGPKGVKKKKYTSTTGSIGVKFNRKLKKPGTYRFLCTIHATVMKQKIEVKGGKKKRG